MSATLRSESHFTRSRVIQAEPELVESSPLPYLISLPAGAMPETGAWPLLCFLHGHDEGAPAPIRLALTRHGPLRPPRAPGAAGRFVVMAPQLPARGDLWHRYGDAVRSLVQQVQALRQCDLTRTYLTGFSFGANGVFDLALAQRGFWAALWAVDPTRVPVQDQERPVWFSAGEVSRHRQDAFIDRLRLVPLDTTTPAADRIYTDEGEDHVGTATRAYRDEGIYTWLLSKRL